MLQRDDLSEFISLVSNS